MEGKHPSLSCSLIQEGGVEGGGGGGGGCLYFRVCQQAISCHVDYLTNIIHGYWYKYFNKYTKKKDPKIL